MERKEIDKVCVSVGKFIEYWGFKEVEGRIWCHILLAKEPLCAQDIMDRTDITKGLASISLARLVEYNVIRIEKLNRPGKTQYYQINENVTEVIREVLRNRERKIITDVAHSIENLLDVPEEELSQYISIDRLNFLKKMVKTARSMLKALIFTEKGINAFFFGKAPTIQSQNHKEEIHV